MAYLGTKPANQIIDSTLIADGTVTPADLSTGKPVWDISGNVGIGTSSPQSSLQVSGSMPVSPTGNGIHMGITTSNTCMQFNAGSGNVSLIDFSTSGTDYLGRILYDNTGNSLQFSTNSTERMRIDASGRVTTPSQPAFRAVFSSAGDQSTANNTVTPFDSESFDVGGNYNTSNYRFTAPVAGKYLFYANLYLTNSAGAFTGGIGFKVNGSNLSSPADALRSDASLGTSGGAMNIMSVQITAIIDLSANDYVQVYGITYGGGSYTYYKGTSFWHGTLLG